MQGDTNLNQGGKVSITEREVIVADAERVNKIREIGAERFFKEELENPAEFFLSNSIHLAGSGIMLPDDEIDKIIAKVRPAKIWSHEGCGAGKLQAKNEGSTEEPEDFTIGKTERIAERNHVEYAGHRRLREMHRPSNKHDARICYYDGTGSFGAHADSDLPRGFVVTRMVSPSIASDVALAEAIAFGPSGLGEEVFSEEPFLVMVFGNPNDPELSYEKLSTEVRELLTDKTGEKVIVDGFDVPAEWLPKPGEIDELVFECIDEGCCAR